jgi:hypothetical protein
MMIDVINIFASGIWIWKDLAQEHKTFLMEYLRGKVFGGRQRVGSSYKVGL